jgi:hypothetical protein
MPHDTTATLVAAVVAREDDAEVLEGEGRLLAVRVVRRQPHVRKNKRNRIARAIHREKSSQFDNVQQNRIISRRREINSENTDAQCSCVCTSHWCA